MPLTGTSVGATVAGILTNTLDLTTVTAPLTQGHSVALSNGTGAGQADKMWSDTRTLTASSSEDLDLAGSALIDPFGVAVVFVKVKAIMVFAAAANTNEVLVGSNVVNGWATLVSPNGASGGVIHVRPGGFMVVAATDATSYPVTAGTGDLLHITNGGAGTSVTFDIVIIGTSA